jgi:hypothetical protein
MASTEVSFVARADPLPAVAVAATGPAVRTLVERLLALSDETLARLTGVANADVAVILGPTDSLPWFDGALFLGSTGALLWPTWAEPSVHPSLFERALRRGLPDAPSGPLALLIGSLSEQSSPRVVPLSAARPLSRATLARMWASP